MEFPLCHFLDREIGVVNDDKIMGTQVSEPKTSRTSLHTSSLNSKTQFVYLRCHYLQNVVRISVFIKEIPLTHCCWHCFVLILIVNKFNWRINMRQKKKYNHLDLCKNVNPFYAKGDGENLLRTFSESTPTKLRKL